MKRMNRVMLVICAVGSIHRRVACGGALAFFLVANPLVALADGITFDGGSGSGLGNPVLGPGTAGYPDYHPQGTCVENCGPAPAPRSYAPSSPQTPQNGPLGNQTDLNNAAYAVGAAIGAKIGNALFGNSAEDQAKARQQQLLEQQQKLQEQQQAALKAAEEQRRKEQAFANQKAGLLQDMTGVQQALGITSQSGDFPQLHRQVPFQQGWTDTPWLDKMQSDLSAGESPPPDATNLPQPKNSLPPKASQPAFAKQRPDQQTTSSSVVDLSGKQGIVDPADLKKDNPNYDSYSPLAKPVPSPAPPQPSWFDQMNKTLEQNQEPVPVLKGGATRG